MSPETLLNVASALLVQLLTLAAGFYYFRRNFTLSKLEKNAEAENDLASATLTRRQAERQLIENYDEVVKRLLQRDMEFAQMNARMATLDATVARIPILEAELLKERNLRLQIEKERDELAAVVSKLQRRIEDLETRMSPSNVPH